MECSHYKNIRPLSVPDRQHTVTSNVGDNSAPAAVPLPSNTMSVMSQPPALSNVSRTEVEGLLRKLELSIRAEMNSCLLDLEEQIKELSNHNARIEGVPLGVTHLVRIGLLILHRNPHNLVFLSRITPSTIHHPKSFWVQLQPSFPALLAKYYR